jgi:hypothetical protein
MFTTKTKIALALEIVASLYLGGLSFLASRRHSRRRTARVARSSGHMSTAAAMNTRP